MDDSARLIEAVYQEHGHAVYAYLRRSVGDAYVAEDLLQETLLQALRGADRLAKAASPRAWLIAIARNLARNTFRRERAGESLPAGTQADPGKDEDPRVEEMRQAITKLSASLRETLNLRLQEELSYEEIATVLGIPTGTVRSRLHHAVRQLREMMNVQGD